MGKVGAVLLREACFCSIAHIIASLPPSVFELQCLVTSDWAPNALTGFDCLSAKSNCSQ
jgi:hypothetical protein